MSDKLPTLTEIFNLPTLDQYECREEGPYQGKLYRRRDLTQVEQGLYTLWLEQEASAWVERQVHLPPAALKAHRDGVRADAIAGRFHIYSEYAIERTHTLDGSAKLLSIVLLADGNAEADHEFCKRLLLGEAERVALKITEAAEADDPKARAALEFFRSLTSTGTKSSGSSAGTSTGSSRPRTTGRNRKSRK